MRFVTFEDENGRRLGVLDNQSVLDPSSADPKAPRDLVELCAGGKEALAAVRAALGRAQRLSLARVRLLAPFPTPRRNLFCVGKNYREHAQEFHASGFDASSASAVPDLPIIFTKAPSSVIGPGDPIPASQDPTHSVDYEGELAVVIGLGGRGVRKGDAFSHVFGYTILNDVTSRTLQHAHKQWFLGKSRDGFCPMGPCVVTADEIPDVGALRLQTFVNGESRQDASLRDLIFDIPTLIETLSEGITLQPGDIVATGTPVGVGIGFKPPKFLKSGDEVTIVIEPIGALANPVA